MLPTSILPFLLFSLLPTALGGLTGDPSLADPNVASTPVDSILHGSFGGPAPLIGKRGLTDTGGLVDRLLSTGDAPLVSTRGLIGTPALLDPNVATTPLGSIIGDAEPVAPLVGKRQTIGACATVGVRLNWLSKSVSSDIKSHSPIHRTPPAPPRSVPALVAASSRSRSCARCEASAPPARSRARPAPTAPR